MKSIEFKIIISIIFFTLFIVGLERYQLSKSITEQFISSKKSKNDLLVNTITPILSLNFSLGLEDANREYLEQITQQNSDLEYVKLTDANENIIYNYHNEHIKKRASTNSYNHLTKKIKDDFTQRDIGTIELKFSNKEYEKMLETNREITLNITAITAALLLLFILFMKHMFKNLNELRDSVLEYDPQKNNFSLERTKKKDEVSLMRNAIISMVEKISVYTKMLANTNALLEEKVKQRTRELEESNAELKLLASVDPLTKLYNRRYFTSSSQQVLQISKRNKTPLAIIMLDIDDFKHINDTYGHQSGDEVIAFVATVLLDLTRKSDIACRFGGEEFVILLPDTDMNGAYTIAEKIRVRIEEQVLNLATQERISISVSLGVAEFQAQSDSSLDDIIKKADGAMYRAKQSGKNRTCFSGDTER